MSSTAITETSLRRDPYSFTPGKLGMWLFLASDAMGFMGLIGGYMVLRISAAEWIYDPPLGITLTGIMTFVLICSSVTMVLSLSAIQRDDKKRFLFWMGATVCGGLIFLGLQAYEWTHLIHAGMSASKSNYGATFFMLTGFHGLHVTIGVIYLSTIWIRGKMGAYNARNNSPVELAGLYWHFVDLVWIILFTIVYLLPEKVAA